MKMAFYKCIISKSLQKYLGFQQIFASEIATPTLQKCSVFIAGEIIAPDLNSFLSCEQPLIPLQGDTLVPISSLGFVLPFEIVSISISLT